MDVEQTTKGSQPMDWTINTAEAIAAKIALPHEIVEEAEEAVVVIRMRADDTFFDFFLDEDGFYVWSEAELDQWLLVENPGVTVDEAADAINIFMEGTR